MSVPRLLGAEDSVPNWITEKEAGVGEDWKDRVYQAGCALMRQIAAGNLESHDAHLAENKPEV